MKKLAIPVLVLVAVVVLLVAQPARGQTPAQTSATTTPSPTVTPTVTPTVPPTTTVPNAQQLVTQATAAATKAGSGHVVLTLNATVTGPDAGKLGMAMEGDAQWANPLLAQLAGTITLTGTTGSKTTVPFAIVVDKTRTAYQVAGNWTCSTAQSLAATTKTPVSPTSTSETVKVNQLSLVGSDVVDGAPVWHVREKATIVDKTKGKKGKVKTTKTPTTLDYYIAQADSTLRRVGAVIKGKSGKDTVRETITVDLSNYGEKVKVSLPAACKGKAKAAARQSRISASRIWRLVRPLRLLKTGRLLQHQLL